jgi:hypothetical protein
VPKKRPADEPILLPDERVAMAFERFDQRRRGRVSARGCGTSAGFALFSATDSPLSSTRDRSCRSSIQGVTTRCQEVPS